MALNDFGIGVIGFGTVGAGVVDLIARQSDLLEKRLGFRLHVEMIADLDLTSDRGVSTDGIRLTDQAEQVYNDPAVDIVVELIGGTDFAADLTRACFRAGKPVITANKALLAEHGAELYALAEAQGVDYAFEASVAGGIPVLKAIREGLVGNRLQAIYGILNGTCNYILHRMEREKLPFDQVLAEAQANGFAEAEPSLDIDGWDTAHKTCVLAGLGFGIPVTLDQLSVSGLRGISGEDLTYARDLGYVVKLLAVIKRVGDQLLATVGPSLIPADHLLGGVEGVFNAVFVKADMVGDTMYYGKGAGREPTASAVVADICDLARNLHSGCPRRVAPMPPAEQGISLSDPADQKARFYLRVEVEDRPGVMARITERLGQHRISIASVVQREQPENGIISVVIVTRAAVTREFLAALDELRGLESVQGRVMHLPIEDLA